MQVLMSNLTQAVSLPVALELLLDAVAAVALEAVAGALMRFAVHLFADVAAVVVVVTTPAVGDALRERRIQSSGKCQHTVLIQRCEKHLTCPGSTPRCRTLMHCPLSHWKRSAGHSLALQSTSSLPSPQSSSWSHRQRSGMH